MATRRTTKRKTSGFKSTRGERAVLAGAAAAGYAFGRGSSSRYRRHATSLGRGYRVPVYGLTGGRRSG